MQWKARIDHPFGWWLGQIKKVSHDCVMVEFMQYPDTSLWRCLEIPFSTRKPSVAISSGCILGCDPSAEESLQISSCQSI